MPRHYTRTSQPQTGRDYDFGFDFDTVYDAFGIPELLSNFALVLQNYNNILVAILTARIHVLPLQGTPQEAAAARVESNLLISQELRRLGLDIEYDIVIIGNEEPRVDVRATVRNIQRSIIREIREEIELVETGQIKYDASSLYGLAYYFEAVIDRETYTVLVNTYGQAKVDELINLASAGTKDDLADAVLDLFDVETEEEDDDSEDIVETIGNGQDRVNNLRQRIRQRFRIMANRR